MRPFEEDPFGLEPRPGVNRDRLAIETARGRLIHRRGALHVRERNQNDPADSGRKSSGKQVREPSHVGLRQESLGSGSEENTGEMDDDVRALDGRCNRLWLRQIRLDWDGIRSTSEI